MSTETGQWKGMKETLVWIIQVVISMRCSLWIAADPPQPGGKGDDHGKKNPLKDFFFSWHKLLQAGPECGCIWFKISLLYTASPKKRCLNWCYQPFGESRRKQGGFVCAVFNWTDRTALPVLALDGIMLCCQGWDNTETGSCVSPSMSLCPWHESFLGFKKSHELLLTHNRLCSLNEKLD